MEKRNVQYPQLDLWLIHKINEKKIIGPMDCTIVKEMIDNSLLHLDDELIQANGYWFKVKETGLVQEFIVNKKPMPFHPCSSILDNLTPDVSLEQLIIKVQQVVDSKGKIMLIPSKEDLEYPK